VNAAMRTDHERRVERAQRIVARRAVKGAAWLDRRRPGWQDRIDTSALDLGSASYCIVGQMVRQGTRDEEDLDVQLAEEMGSAYPPGLGFDIGPDAPWNHHLPYHQIYSMLTEAWLAEIAKRRATP
jgi:hypothetical protein